MAQDEILSLASCSNIRRNASDPEQYIDQTTTIRVPSVQKMKREEKPSDDLEAIPSAPITCTLPLIELMKLKPDLWEGLVEKLVAHEILNKGSFDNVGLNKVSGVKAKDEGNTTLPVTYKGIESIAILDSGARISIATKSIWESGVNRLSNQRA